MRALTASGVSPASASACSSAPSRCSRKGSRSSGSRPISSRAKRSFSLTVPARVGLGDPADRADVVPHRQVRGRAAVGQAAPLGQRDPLAAQGAAQLGDQARLAHARLADDADHLAAARRAPAPWPRSSAASTGSRPTKRPSGRASRPACGDRCGPEPHDAVGAHRVGLPLHPHRSHGLEPDGAGHQPGGRLAGQDRSRARPGAAAARPRRRSRRSRPARPPGSPPMLPSTTSPLSSPMRTRIGTAASPAASAPSASRRRSPRAARTARRAWSSWAAGAPISAMKPSPSSCSPCRRSGPPRRARGRGSGPAARASPRRRGAR